MDSVDLDVENLFDDNSVLSQNGLDQFLPPTDHVILSDETLRIPISAPVVERIIQLSYTGSLNRVAWSRQGHVASIADDGTTVNIQCLRVLPASNRWTLSQPKPLEATFENATTMLWSPSGVDLAVVDSKGRVSFYYMVASCLNRLNEMRSGLADPPDELGQPIVTYWLSQDRPERPTRPTISHATRSDKGWSLEHGKAKLLGQQYPRAFIAVSKQGAWSVTYTRPDGQFRKASGRLPVPPGSLFTHAAIAPTADGKQLLALHSHEGRLSLHTCSIAWPPEWRTSSTDPAHPVLTTEVVDLDIPILFSNPSSTGIGLDQLYSTNSWVLTHLQIIPVSDVEGDTATDPQIWGVFSSMNNAANTAEVEFLQSSVVRRWVVSTKERKLHPKFDEIPTKAPRQVEKQTATLVSRLVDQSFSQVIISLDFVENGHNVALTFVDGTTQLWNPDTMSRIDLAGQPDEVTSMAQSGFVFNGISPAITATLSPNVCTTIISQQEGKLVLNQALYLGQLNHGLVMSDPQQSAAATSLILAFARSCWSNSNSDDVLAAIASACESSQVPALIASAYQIMFRMTEFGHEKAPGSELERILQKPMTGKVLSFHFALLTYTCSTTSSSTAPPAPPAWSRLWAWISINLRYITTSLFVLFKELHTAAQNPSAPAPNFPPSYIEMVGNMIKWTFDVYRYIIEAMIEVADRQSNPDMFDAPESWNLYNLGDEEGNGSQGLVALLVNCNWSRSFLLSATRPMHFFREKADSSIPIVRHAVETIHRYSIAKGLPLEAIEKIFDGRWFERAGLAENESYSHDLIGQRQIEMMTTGRVGPYYQNTIKDIVAKVINSENGLRYRPGGIQRYKLFVDTPDVSWILLGIDARMPALSGSSAQTSDHDKLFDVHKKSLIVIHSGQEPTLIRRCVRCGAASEDPTNVNTNTSPKREWPKAILNSMARCICEGHWILEEFDGLANEEAEERKKAKQVPAIDDIAPLNASDILKPNADDDGGESKLIEMD